MPRLRIAGWATLTQGLAQQRQGGVRRPRARSSRACRTSAPTRTRVRRHLDGVEAGDPVDVDEVRRGGQAHVEERDQALPAGEHLAVVADLGEDGDGLVDGARCVVHEGGGLHRTDPAFLIAGGD